MHVKFMVFTSLTKHVTNMNISVFPINTTDLIVEILSI